MATFPENSEFNPVDPNAMISLFGVEDKTLFSKLMNSFVEKTEGDIQGLCTALTSNEPQTVVEIAHKIKSAARSIGANDLAALCEFLEQQGKSEGLERPQDMAVELGTRFEQVSQFVAAY